MYLKTKLLTTALFILYCSGFTLALKAQDTSPGGLPEVFVDLGSIGYMNEEDEILLIPPEEYRAPEGFQFAFVSFGWDGNGAQIRLRFLNQSDGWQFRDGRDAEAITVTEDTTYVTELLTAHMGDDLVRMERASGVWYQEERALFPTDNQLQKILLSEDISIRYGGFVFKLNSQAVELLSSLERTRPWN